MKLSGLTVLLQLSAFASARPSPPSKPAIPGRFVPFDKLDSCPTLTPRSRPTHVKDVRPDDFKVFMALGDSISAGLLARSSRDNELSHHSGISDPTKRNLERRNRDQTPLQLDPDPSLLPIELLEYRGISYAIGGDPLAITLPGIASHFTNNTPFIGPSVGSHLPLACLGGVCLHPEDDGLNGAVSGAKGKDMVGQVRDYLIPTLEKLGVQEEDWKYVNLGIGGNDVCDYCLVPNTSLPLHGTPQEFAASIHEALTFLHSSIPNTIVNLIGLFRVSSIYNLTREGSRALQPPILPHLPLECRCASLPGPAGDYTRMKMDELSESYDLAVREVVKDWEDHGDPAFGVMWQPGSFMDLGNWPTEALSPVDCFHPSEKAHQRTAAGIWNRMTLTQKEKAVPVVWEDDVWVRCLEEGDRIRIGLGR